MANVYLPGATPVKAKAPLRIVVLYVCLSFVSDTLPFHSARPELASSTIPVNEFFSWLPEGVTPALDEGGIVLMQPLSTRASMMITDNNK